MGIRDLHLKLKGFRLRRMIVVGGGRKREADMEKRASWMTPVSHGCHVQDRSLTSGPGSDSDSVVVQREQIEDIELWFFGVFDPQIGDRVTKYMQSHLFGKKSKELSKCILRKKSKEIMRKAHVGARAKMRETVEEDEEQAWRVGSASALVINGSKLVMANMGDYRAVVCRDGVAHQLTTNPSKWRHWSRRLFPLHIFSCKSESTKSRGSSYLAVGAERIEADTEFVILGSTGIWEVMKSQEAVSLIRHLEDAQEARVLGKGSCYQNEQEHHFLHGHSI